MADDPVVPTNTLPPIPFNEFSIEDKKILNPNKAVDEATPVRSLPWSKNLGNLNADQIRSSRQKWIDSKLPVEQFDAAIIADGGTPPDFETEKLERAHGLQSPHPNEIKFEHPVAQRYSAELTGFIQAARLNGGLGAAVVDRIAEAGNKTMSMTAAERTAWTLAQEKLGLVLSGGRNNWEAAKVKAKEFLDRIKTTADAKNGADLAKNLSQSVVMGDAFLVCTFSTAQEMWASYAAAAARRKK